MTVNSTTNRVSYTRNGTANPLAVSFPFQAAADLVVVETVIATGVDTVMTLTTDYTVGGTPDANGFYPNGGTVTPVATKSSAYRWTIYRDPALTQLVDIVDNDPLPAASIENPVDKLTMIAQRLRELSNRSLRQSEGDTGSLGALPAASTLVNKVFHMGSDGKTPTASSVDITDLEAYSDAILDAAATLQASGSITPGMTFTPTTAVGTNPGVSFGIGIVAPEAPLHVGANSLVAEADPGIGLARTLGASPAGNGHGFVDVSILDRSGGIGYASYDAWPTTANNATNYDHIAGYQARISHGGSGTIGAMYGAYLGGLIPGTGTVTAGYGAYINGIGPGFGTITTNYGLYVADISGGNPYGIYVDGTSKCRFNPRVGIGADPGTSRQLEVTTTSVVGGYHSNIWATAASAPTVRLLATGGPKWSGIAGGTSGGLTFLVGGDPTGSPTEAGSFGGSGGFVVGSPTGGNKGAGTVNATAVYDDNVLLTDYVFDVHLDGKLRTEDAKSRPANEFIARANWSLDLDSYIAYWRGKRHLPGFISRTAWHEGTLPSTGQLAQQVWEGLEVHAVHIATLHDTIKQLEKRLAKLDTPWWTRWLNKLKTSGVVA